MKNLAVWVKETGAGFMMTGGKHAYGPGGYFRSPLEPIMPVSMELRQRAPEAITCYCSGNGQIWQYVSNSGQRQNEDAACEPRHGRGVRYAVADG